MVTLPANKLCLIWLSLNCTQNVGKRVEVIININGVDVRTMSNYHGDAQGLRDRVDFFGLYSTTTSVPLRFYARLVNETSTSTNTATVFSWSSWAVFAI